MKYELILIRKVYLYTFNKSDKWDNNMKKIIPPI